MRISAQTPWMAWSRQRLLIYVGLAALAAAACAAPAMSAPPVRVEIVGDDDTLERQDLAAQRGMLFWAQIMGVLTGLGVLVSIVNHVSGKRQPKPTEEAVKDAAKSATAAADAAFANLALARPWLVISVGPGTNLATNYDGVVTESGLILNASVENIGLMPATGIRIYAFQIANEDWKPGDENWAMPELNAHNRWGDLRPGAQVSHQVSTPWEAERQSSARLILVATYHMPGRSDELMTAQPLQVSVVEGSQTETLEIAGHVFRRADARISTSPSFRSIYK